ncbi:MAG: helix-turn-helix domain-containing protein, partial [Gammaproteobacteria bacterium]|nr:helix-turn-helix domain-containing protein [Gammaproteobacteria bacterium]
GNVRYYLGAAAAQDAGYRPCRRCRPESAQRLPEWTLGSDTVLRGLRLVEAGYLNHHSVQQLATTLEVGERHLSRLFSQEIGSSPKTVAKLFRAKLAKDLLASTQMSHIDVAEHSGYGSVSRFNAEIRSVYHCAPKDLRGENKPVTGLCITVVLDVPAPYDFDWIFSYLDKRALLGVEGVSGGPGTWVYSRLIQQQSSQQPQQWLSVAQEGMRLRVNLPLSVEPIHSLLRRVRRVFDLNADGQTVHETLLKDSRLGAWVKAAPGLRVPGAWDGFETAVRAVLGQQVSVARGTVLANKMIDKYGGGLFPTARQLVDREVAELGMPGRRGRAVSKLAALTLAGVIDIDDCQNYERVQAQLQDIEGIGPWTANYIRMRALKDPDAFPDNDWVVLKELECTPSKARKRAAAWQPWRAYALMYLWYAAGVRKKVTRGSP